MIAFQLHYLKNRWKIIFLRFAELSVFRRSPVKNYIPQKYVNEEKRIELSLLLDCKTRWNSLIATIERFILLKSLLVTIN